MPDGSALRVPGLQSQGSLAAVPYDTLIEPLLTWPRSVFPHRTPVSSRAWDGWCFSNEHLFNIWFSPPFAACGSRDHYSNPAMNTELLICL